MEKCVLHLYFYVLNMDDVNFVLGYPWMELVSIVNITMKKNFLNLWYKKNKVTIYRIFLSFQNKKNP